jgi:succinate dehydrogenase / fumarate reductase cytochrome b subunit
MSQASAGASDKARKSADPAPPRTFVQPLSPHLQIWRWHITMWGSILHRVSGVGLYGGAILVALWLAALAGGRDSYTLFLTYAAHPAALVIWVGLTLAAFYHLFSGIRHLVWDAVIGLAPKSANMLVSLSIWASLLATVGFWTWMFMAERISL